MRGKAGLPTGQGCVHPWPIAEPVGSQKANPSALPVRQYSVPTQPADSVLRAGGVTTGMTLETTQRVDFRHYRCKPAEYGPMTSTVMAREGKFWEPQPAWNWHEPRSGSAPATFERIRPSRDNERA